MKSCFGYVGAMVVCGSVGIDALHASRTAQQVDNLNQNLPIQDMHRQSQETNQQPVGPKLKFEFSRITDGNKEKEMNPAVLARHKKVSDVQAKNAEFARNKAEQIQAAKDVLAELKKKKKQRVLKLNKRPEVENNYDITEQQKEAKSNAFLKLEFPDGDNTNAGYRQGQHINHIKQDKFYDFFKKAKENEQTYDGMVKLKSKRHANDLYDAKQLRNTIN